MLVAMIDLELKGRSVLSQNFYGLLGCYSTREKLPIVCLDGCYGLVYSLNDCT
jgi:hypothetical protein